MTNNFNHDFDSRVSEACRRAELRVNWEGKNFRVYLNGWEYRWFPKTVRADELNESWELAETVIEELKQIYDHWLWKRPERAIQPLDNVTINISGDSVSINREKGDEIWR